MPNQPGRPRSPSQILFVFGPCIPPILVKYTCKISAYNFHPLVIYAHLVHAGSSKIVDEVNFLAFLHCHISGCMMPSPVKFSL